MRAFKNVQRLLNDECTKASIVPAALFFTQASWNTMTNSNVTERLIAHCKYDDFYIHLNMPIHYATCYVNTFNIHNYDL